MKDVDKVLKDLRNTYNIPFKIYDKNIRGETLVVCTYGMLHFLKDTVKNAEETIRYLQADRAALLEQLEEEHGG